MQKIFPCLEIKKIFSPSWYVQQETIFSVGKGFAIINPWDCLEVGVKILFDKLSFKSNKTNFLIDFLNLEKDELIENCFRHESLID